MKNFTIHKCKTKITTFNKANIRKNFSEVFGYDMNAQLSMEHL